MTIRNRYAMSFEARCQHLDLFCQRLEGLASQLSQTVETLARAKDGHHTDMIEDELLQAANVSRSLPESGEPLHLALDPSLRPVAPTEPPEVVDTATENSRAESVSDTFGDDDLDFSEDQNSGSEKFGSLVTDSYGKLR